MTLLRTIQDAAVGGTESITALLRRCKILAARLASIELGEWVESELNGYGNINELPAYRTLSVRSLGHFSGPFGSGLRNAPIPPSSVPEKFRHWVNSAPLMQPIGAYEDLIRSGGKSGSFQVPWPDDLLVFLGREIYENMHCASAWQVIPRGAIVALLDTVRNRVLSFALDIERLSPDAGEASPGSATISRERVQQVFHTHIYGNVGNVAAGATNARQTIGAIVTPGDFSSLAEQLRGLGVDESHVAELRSAIEIDQASNKSKLGHNVGEWLGKVLGKAGEGTLKVGVETAAAVLPKLILEYLGLK